MLEIGSTTSGQCQLSGKPFGTEKMLTFEYFKKSTARPNGHRAKDCQLKKEKESNQSNFIINNVTDGKKSKLYLPLSFPGASSTVMFECDTGSYYTLIR